MTRWSMSRLWRSWRSSPQLEKDIQQGMTELEAMLR